MPANSPRPTRLFPPHGQRQRAAERQTASRSDKGHGRRERRTVESTTGLNHYMHGLGWPSVQQAFRITREQTVWDRDTSQEKTTVEVCYYITDLTRTNANAHDLLRHTRNHWGIENRLHWVRDETFGEDRCRVRGPNAPQVLAAVRNALISALRFDEVPNIAAALRNFAWNNQRAFAWLGILN